MYTPSKELCEPFILQEQHIRKIIDIIERRKPENAGSKYDPIYTYKRLDNYERTTKDINDLFKEDNCGVVRITSLEISSEHYLITDSDLNYEIQFKSYEDSEEDILGLMFFKSITLGVKGEERDIVELLFNELNNYITNTVISHKHKKLVRFLKKCNSMVLIPVLFVLVLILVPFISLTQFNQIDRQELIENAIASTDVSQKLNTLLQLYQGVGDSNKILFSSGIIFLVVFIMFIVLRSDKIKRKLYYYYPFVFDFGTSPEDYKTRISRIKWIIGIIGTLFLGILGNYLYSIISSI